MKKIILTLPLLVPFISIALPNDCSPSKFYDESASRRIITAVDRGDISRLRGLFEAGLPVDWIDHKGRSLLERACARGRTDLVRELLNRNADINHQDNEGNTALYRACQEEKCDLVSLLIGKGVEVNLANNQGITPLYVASKKGQETLIDLLCEAGAQISIASREQQETPLWIAAKQGSEKIVAKLLDYCLANESTRKIIDQSNNKGISPLLIACYQGHENVVAQLLRQGASVNQAKEDGITPLMVATAHGYLSIVQLLLAHGADVELRASKQVGGGSALDYAKQVNNPLLCSALEEAHPQKSQAKKKDKELNLIRSAQKEKEESPAVLLSSDSSENQFAPPVVAEKLSKAIETLKDHFNSTSSPNAAAWRTEVPVQDVAAVLTPAEQQALQQADKIVVDYNAKYSQSLENLTRFSKAKQKLSKVFSKAAKVTKDVVSGPDINSLKMLQQQVNAAYGQEVIKLDQARLEKNHKERLTHLTTSHQQKEKALELELEQIRTQLKTAPHRRIELMEKQQQIANDLVTDARLYQTNLARLQNPLQAALSDFHDWKRTVFYDFVKLHLGNYFITYEALALGTVARHPEAYEQALQGSTTIASILSDAFLPLGGLLGTVVGTVVEKGAGLYADKQVRLKSAKIGSLYNYSGLEGMVKLAQEVADGLLFRLKDGIVDLTPESLDKLAKVATTHMIDYALKQWELDENKIITASDLLLRSAQHEPSWFKSLLSKATLETEDGRSFDGWALLTQTQQVVLDDGRFKRAARFFAKQAKKNGGAFINYAGQAVSVVTDFVSF
ncbi:ankyrin repeat domain-containing protein [Candidatus Odyssella thessalonicensis]|uniref:ankyrin repeat domain-containing protein n=1 Tax=Candidatus Odyssella thessalonicensis TaxID=84647 RepID=UPI000225B494|nr:ankyrin repeat domain-containing protein [Candidatus Odyssella thessalonicensis]